MARYVLKESYIGKQAHKTTISYLTDGSLTIERNKEVANDQVLQLKMNFGWKIFSKCFTPVSNYPNQISGLTSWLRADSNVTFSIPTKKVSVIGDGSGNGNGVSQSVASGQPYRYSYGGGTLDKTMFTFDSNILNSQNNFTTSLTTEQFSVFEVSKINGLSNAVFGYFHLSDGSLIEMGTNASGYYEVSVSDGTTTLTKNTGTVDTGKFHIASLRKAGQDIYFNYYDSANTFYAPDFDASFVGATSFEQDKFRLGCTQTTDGLIPPAAINTRYLDGDWQELIIYDRKLTDDETAKVVDYLNKKYKIY